jgi:hypothetical protein
MTDDEYDELAKRHAKALGESMKKITDDACNKVEGYSDLTPAEQEFVKREAILNVGVRFGGFSKKENT